MEISREEFQESPVHTHASLGDVTQLLAVLASGASPNDPNFRGVPPLHCAAEHGQLDCMRVLLDAKADVMGVHGARGTTPAHVAASGGFADCLRYLIEAGADPKAKNMWGDSVVKVA